MLNQLRTSISYALFSPTKRNVPPLKGELAASVVDKLRMDGGCQLHLRDFIGEDGAKEFVEAASKIGNALSIDESNSGRSYIVFAPETEIRECEPIVKFGLSETVLDIVENYFGAPCVFRGVRMRREIPNDDFSETRIFHYDGDDSFVVKFIVYLNEITRDDGPFEFVLRSAVNADDVVKPGDSKNRVSDELMETKVPRDQWISVVGEAGTVAIADTAAVFHRGALPTSGVSRIALFYSFVTQKPSNPSWCKPTLNLDKLKTGASWMNDRQKAAATADYYKYFMTSE